MRIYPCTEEQWLTCHGVVLAETVYNVALIRIRESRLALLVIVADAMVNLVGDEDDTLLLANLGQGKVQVLR